MIIKFLILFSLSFKVFAIQNGVHVKANFIDRVVYLTNNCSGFLIDKNTVLTASHCLRYGWDNLYVNQYFDSFNRGHNPLSRYNVFDKNLYEVRKVIEAEVFSYEYSQELAILKLEDSLNSKDLSPFSFVNIDTNFENMNLTFAGFGPDYSKNRRQRYGFKVGSLPFHKMSNVHTYEQEMLFLGSSKRKTGQSMACYGDSGGPVLKVEGDKIELVGISQSVLGLSEDFENSSIEAVCKKELANFLIVIPFNKEMREWINQYKD